MPNIVEYTNPIDGLQPNQVGSGAYAMLGRRVAGAYEQLGRDVGSAIATAGDHYEKYETHQEISRGIANFATIQDGLTQKWNEMASTADPNDPTTAQKFREQVLAPALEEWQKGFSTEGGQNWAMERSASLQQHMFEKTAADMSTLAGSALVQNLDVLKNRGSNLVMKDPTSLNSILGLVDNSVDALIANNPNIQAGQAAKVRTELTQNIKREITRSAFIGMADANPAAAIERLQAGAGSEYLDGQDVKVLQGYAETKQRANEAQARSDEAEQRRQDKAAFGQAAAGLQASIINPEDGSLRLPKDYYAAVMKLAAMPEADAGEVRAMVNMGRQVAKDEGKATTDPTVYETFNARLASGDLSAKDIYQARGSGLLSDKDTSFFLKATHALSADPQKKLAEQQLNRFLASQKSAFTQTNILGGRDPAGDQRYYAFSTAVRTQFEKAYSSGGDWQGMLTPNNPSFLGKLAPAYLHNQKGVDLGAPVRIQDDAGYAKLPKGASFIGPDGKMRVKP